MLKRNWTKEDLSKYPEFFQEILRHMERNNLSNRQIAKMLDMDHMIINKYINNPHTIPRPKIFTSFIKLFPNKSRLLLKHIKE